VCKSQQAIDEYLGKETFSFAFVNSMFVAGDFEKPHQTFIDDQLFFELDPRVAKKANFFVQLNQASLEDDLL
jgi:hypothetical protein